MKHWKGMVLTIVVASLSCQDSTGPRQMKLKVPHVPRFVEVEVDPTCNYVSMECAYRIGGVTITGGAGNNDPPLIIWTVSSPDPPSVYDYLPYPSDGNYSGWFGASILSNDHWLAPGGTIAEQACDPRPLVDPNCLKPIQPRDSVVFLSFLADMEDQTLYFTSDDEMDSQEMIDECTQIRIWLRGAIYDTFNRPAGETNYGLFRGRNVSGPFTNQNEVHGGATHIGAGHADEYMWEIYAADSIAQRRALVRVLAHEAVHMNGPNHKAGLTPDYANYRYFKYLIPGSRRSCIRWH